MKQNSYTETRLCSCVKKKGIHKTLINIHKFNENMVLLGTHVTSSIAFKSHKGVIKNRYDFHIQTHILPCFSFNTFFFETRST